MIYLFIQTLFWIALAVIAGIFIGWLVWGRKAAKDESHQQQSPRQASSSLTDGKEEASSEFAEIKEDFRPQALKEPMGGKSDDLTQINGIGPKINETLHSLGIYHFTQIAEFSRENIAWVDHYLSFKGRIDREDWVGQAKKIVKENKENS